MLLPLPLPMRWLPAPIIFRLLCCLLPLVLVGCSPPSKTTQPTALRPGVWRAVIASPGGELPFGLELVPLADSVTYAAFARNGTERLALDTATVFGDSVRIPMSLFESELVARLGDSTLTGTFVKRGLTTRTEMNFTATHGFSYRFAPGVETSTTDNTTGVNGKWAVTFAGQDGKTYPAVGVFAQRGTQVTGTFLTTTGDYRYLAGDVAGRQLRLSCFDGTHVFLFHATLDSTGHRLTNGQFWAGKTGHETWTATRDSAAALPDAGTLTFLKKGYDRLTFTFPDPAGRPVSLADERFRGKVVVVQIMGSWCPNCMDETNFLAPWYRRNRARGAEVVGLAYEKTADLVVSGPKLQRMIARFGIQYPVLLAGVNDKAKAAQTLPALEAVLAFPTTIFVDRRGKVRHVHTGFSGPGTGQYYLDYVASFERLVDQLLAEKP